MRDSLSIDEDVHLSVVHLFVISVSILQTQHPESNVMKSHLMPNPTVHS